ncbi:auxin-responsive protein IAA28-like [Andrographis paniculata]|uniref:auxin-responsive protein IAA28-like n=1 Tax=Andrographis paniculata TaxID=175694 RepID=UPI0021E71FFB|nr:auxin-responsive protein IAA28-like [Andrographis paniculata]
MEVGPKVALSNEEEEENTQKRSFENAFLNLDQSLEINSGNAHRKKLALPNRDGGAMAVGWPPVKSWKKKSNLRRDNSAVVVNYVNVENGGAARRPENNNSTYVKVKMEGVGIGRKVNLSIHNSYRSLTAHLVALFGEFGEDDGDKYQIMYEDKNGDCLLAGDLPWENFVGSVQKMKLQRIRD